MAWFVYSETYVNNFYWLCADTHNAFFREEGYFGYFFFNPRVV